jgi:hypothetical protein
LEVEAVLNPRVREMIAEGHAFAATFCAIAFAETTQTAVMWRALCHNRQPHGQTRGTSL